MFKCPRTMDKRHRGEQGILFGQILVNSPTVHNALTTMTRSFRFLPAQWLVKRPKCHFLHMKACWADVIRPDRVWISCSVLETYIKDMGQLARGWLQKEWPFIDRQISMLANVHECPKVLHLMTGLCSPHYMTVSYISTATKLMLWLFHHKKQFAVDITWFNGLFIYITSSSQNIFCWNNLQFFLRFVVEIIF